MPKITDIYQKREKLSRTRLEELSRSLNKLEELTAFPKLTIFGVGSYARLEASAYSDIDLFFLYPGKRRDIVEPHTNEIRLFGKVIEIIDKMGLPKFSNDGQYLTILHTDDIVENLGNPTDDHANYFTARMLLLLESQCLCRNDEYTNVIAQIVSSYFKDYPDHEKTFQPTFLLNDICRFWKTLLLNYENKRKIHPESDERKTKQKVRNFKLKFSRMTTCFASIIALGSYIAPVKEEHVIEMTKLTPRERLAAAASRDPELRPLVDKLLGQYAWFLEMTGLPEADLIAHFRDKQSRINMFGKANDYGDTMFKLLQAVDKKDNLLRYLVI